MDLLPFQTISAKESVSPPWHPFVETYDPLARGAFTLELGQAKDHIVQASTRLRQLDEFGLEC
ncbi:hypothetical protein BKA81DRAFT_343502 [Phyllosticta paracitricarpa]